MAQTARRLGLSLKSKEEFVSSSELRHNYVQGNRARRAQVGRVEYCAHSTFAKLPLNPILSIQDRVEAEGKIRGESAPVAPQPSAATTPPTRPRAQSASVRAPNRRTAAIRPASARPKRRAAPGSKFPFARASIRQVSGTDLRPFTRRLYLTRSWLNRLKSRPQKGPQSWSANLRIKA